MTDWKQKLLAYLHDPPHKPFNVRGHKKARIPLLEKLGIPVKTMKAWRAAPDHVAASADRMMFPHWRRLIVGWRKHGFPFIHPFAGTIWNPSDFPENATIAGNWIGAAIDRIARDKDEKANYFRIWRFWRDEGARDTEREVFAYMPADTRIPDHTIWQHNSLTAAIENCRTGKQLSCAFLLFQIGPVQDFISQARKT